jgi:hypothetical protein
MWFNVVLEDVYFTVFSSTVKPAHTCCKCVLVLTELLKTVKYTFVCTYQWGCLIIKKLENFVTLNTKMKFTCFHRQLFHNI